jgi:DNA-binding MarR family transcriptional regulator
MSPDLGTGFETMGKTIEATYAKAVETGTSQADIAETLGQSANAMAKDLGFEEDSKFVETLNSALDDTTDKIEGSKNQTLLLQAAAAGIDLTTIIADGKLVEEEIKQNKKFSNEFEKLAVNILYTSSWLEAQNIQRFKPYGISPQQYNVLRILRGSSPKPLMLSDISSRMIDKNSNATRLVEKLRLKGFVKREVCENNRRQVDIVITSKGLDLLTEIDNATDTWGESFKSITKSEAEALNNVLDRLRE